MRNSILKEKKRKKKKIKDVSLSTIAPRNIHPKKKISLAKKKAEG